jgi:hypothetical protein
MEEFKEAVSTEYNGIIYKSKSEAIIARAFDLVKTDPVMGSEYRIYHFYEPEYFALEDGYVPDFLIFKGVKDDRDGMNLLYGSVIEYKPSAVTESYQGNLLHRFERLNVKTFGPVDIELLLMIGSPYTTAKKQIFSFYQGTFREGPGWDSFGLTDEILAKARNYRFDLA